MNRRCIRSIAMIALLLACIMQVSAVDHGEMSFSMFFEKPTHDSFDFTSADGPDVPLSGGVVFPLPQYNDPKLPSTAYIGISYDLESSCTLEIWCNALGQRNDKDFRMRRDPKVGEQLGKGLNYVVGIGPDKVSAEKVASIDGFNSGASLNVNESSNATVPVLTIRYDKVTEKQTITYGNTVPSVHGQDAGHEFSSAASGNQEQAKPGSGFQVMCMKIVVPMVNGVYNSSYNSGQYKGYITMLYVQE